MYKSYLYETILTIILDPILYDTNIFVRKNGKSERIAHVRISERVVKGNLKLLSGRLLWLQ